MILATVYHMNVRGCAQRNGRVVARRASPSASAESEKLQGVCSL